jgi:hypothetical protein
MLMHESQPVKVTLVVAVDGHHLSFEAMGKARGARYHGQPVRLPYGESDVLERTIRDAAHESIMSVHDRAAELLARMYPYAGEPGEVTS